MWNVMENETKAKVSLVSFSKLFRRLENSKI